MQTLSTSTSGAGTVRRVGPLAWLMFVLLVAAALVVSIGVLRAGISTEQTVSASHSGVRYFSNGYIQCDEQCRDSYIQMGVIPPGE